MSYDRRKQASPSFVTEMQKAYFKGRNGDAPKSEAAESLNHALKAVEDEIRSFRNHGRGPLGAPIGSYAKIYEQLWQAAYYTGVASRDE